jgi:hypothetical protein
MEYGVNVFNGSPAFNTEHKDSNGNILDLEGVWGMIKAHDDDNDIITAGSHFCGSGKSQQIQCSHAYTVLHTYTLQGGNHDGTRLLKIRNPWGSELYQGNWSDGDSKWTQEYKDQVGYPGNKNDGIFYMDITSYLT